MKIDRLLGILTLLLRDGQATAPELARRFEVSRRTIIRDMDALCMAGIPIVTRQGKGGGIAIAEGFRLDKSLLTTQEMTSLLCALRGIGSVSEPSHIEGLLTKFPDAGDALISLREPIVIDLASHYKSSLTDKITRIKQAILSHRLISFDYYTMQGIHRRCIEPAFVIFKWTAWYVFGFCRMRKDFRLFRLQRLWDVSVDDVPFVPRPIPPDRRDLDAAFPDTQRLVARFSPQCYPQLLDMYSPGCITTQADGRLELDIGFTNEDYIVSWLLGFGAEAQVLHPPQIVARIADIAENLSRLYRKT